MLLFTTYYHLPHIIYHTLFTAYYYLPHIIIYLSSKVPVMPFEYATLKCPEHYAQAIKTNLVIIQYNTNIHMYNIFQLKYQSRLE